MGRYWLKDGNKHSIKQEETEPENSTIASAALKNSANNTLCSGLSSEPGYCLPFFDAAPLSFVEFEHLALRWYKFPRWSLWFPWQGPAERFDTVSHLFTAQTISYTKEREVSPDFSSWRTQQLRHRDSGSGSSRVFRPPRARSSPPSPSAPGRTLPPGRCQGRGRCAHTGHARARGAFLKCIFGYIHSQQVTL